MLGRCDGPLRQQFGQHSAKNGESGSHPKDRLTHQLHANVQL